MNIHDIPFGVTDWSTIPQTEHAGETGTAYWRTCQFGPIRVRMVEYTANYLADHWCVKGHILLCIEGELQTELQDGRVYTLRPGMSYQVSDHGEPHRGRKLGRWMMEVITSHHDLQGLRRFVLVTRDAHGLYGKFGFRALARHEGYMEKHRPDIYTA